MREDITYSERKVNFWECGISSSIDLKALRQEFLKGTLGFSIKHFSLLFLLSKRRANPSLYFFLKSKSK